MFRILFQLGRITITTYGVMLATAFIAGIIIAERRGIRYGVPKDTVGNLSLLILLGAIAGSRAFYVFSHLSDYSGEWQRAFYVWEGGLTFYGGVILAFLLSVIWTRRRSLPFGKLADIVAPSLALGVGIGRIGCFLNGCCFGKPSNFGVIFPPDSPCAWELGVGVRVHPTQLYSSLAGFSIFGILLLLEKRKNFSGELLVWFFLLYGLWRFSIDFIRYYSPSTYIFPNVTNNQVVSLVVFILSLTAIIHLRKKPKKGKSL
ncbi:prolipoprotein diacylglyceryl transferase [candidate division WOR-3 bacterium JGI_Cruoil_03_44_89]|uniref:Phosphatidylglycerol--prolipoprotein diacylglyceryl transferase n=1 Tax=candidate division WOR-3 bacterium JGI_Cruoil_03_44_89 TaxID=1973748 RepID=A0A235BRA3_UNCW3|nr:MAG: prolipoprotein diacylglyceryl transferase [candidate division WOR-3 bacterium JGI_Cruoil_03_44_89]